MLDIIAIPFGYVMRFCYLISGGNYLIALLFFALIMQIILLPFAIKQQKNSIKQASLAPKVAAIRKKYAGREDKATQQKVQQETMDLYSREKFNPMGGCLPLLIQLPILFALFRIVTRPLYYLCQLESSTINAMLTAVGRESKNAYAELLLTKDIQQGLVDTKLFNGIQGLDISSLKLPQFSIGSFDVSATPTFNPPSWLLLVPLLTFVALIASQKLTKLFTYQPPEAKETQNNMSMKLFTYAMPLLSVYISFTVPAALGIYWIFRNVLSVLQQFIMSKVMPLPRFTEEDYKEAERELNLSSKKKKKKVKSLHRIEEYDEDEDEDDEVAAITDGKSKNVTDENSSAALKGDAMGGAAAMKDDKSVTYEKKAHVAAPRNYQKTGKKYKKK